MRLGNLRPTAVIAFVAMLLVPLESRAATSDAPGENFSLVVQAHPGAESIDVSGRGRVNRPITITLVSTFSYDVPDVVLSRTPVVTDAGGAFSAVISIAPGFTRGSVITVYVTTPDGAAASTARYSPDAPNRGVVTPIDQVPKAVR